MTWNEDLNEASQRTFPNVMVIDPNVSIFPMSVFTPVVLIAKPIVTVMMAVAVMFICLGRRSEATKRECNACE